MTSVTFVKKWNIYCERYDCAKCPMRLGSWCFYYEQDYLQKRRGGN